MVKATTVKELELIVNKQNKRINRLETEVKKLKNDQSVEDDDVGDVEAKLNSRKSLSQRSIGFSSTTVITTIGIIGVVIGLVSFFMYAIAHDWIGPSAQVGIGIMVGLVLFITGYKLYTKHEEWAITSFGGAIAIEIISVGFGVWYYNIIHEVFALIFLFILLSIGFSLSIKYNSPIIAYFSMVGGIITPVISKTYTKPLFTILFLLILATGTLALSKYKLWKSLRMSSFLAIVGYEFYLFNSFGQEYSSGLSAEISIIFLSIFFLIYNLSSISFSVQKDKNISELDITLLSLNTFFSAILLARIFFFGDEVITRETFGILLLATSFFFLFEVYYLKTRYAKNKHIKPTIYSLLSSGIILINIGLVLIFSTSDITELILLALPQWTLYTYLSKSNNDKNYYVTFSNIFLVVTLFWNIQYVIQLPESLADTNFVIISMLTFLGILGFFVKKGLYRRLNSIVLIVGGYTFFYPLMEYIKLVIDISPEVATTVLSGLWLAYSLTIYIKTKKTRHLGNLANLSLCLLIITLIKIAFWDLTRLEGVVRIIGFIAFGILLLVGGYLLKKSNKD